MNASNAPKPSVFSRLYVQVLVAIVLGILTGLLLRHLSFAHQITPKKQAQTEAILQAFATGFVKLIKMLLAPIIFGTIVVGIARMGRLRSVGRVGLKAIIYFEVVSTFALVIGLVVVNLVHPGRGMNIDPASLDPGRVSQLTAAAKYLSPMDFILNIIPSSAGGAFVDGNMLQVILVSLLFGVSLALVKEGKKIITEWLEVFLHVIFGIVRFVMRLAPLAAFGSIAAIVSKYGFSTLQSYGKLLASAYATALLFVVIVLGLIARYSGVSLWQFLKYIKDEIFIVFGTNSTEAVMPQMMIKLEKIGCAESVVGLVLPAGYTFNPDGTAIYLTMAAVFIAQALNIPLSLGDQLLILAVMLLTSKGSAGVASGGLVTLAATLASMNGKIPVAGVGLLVAVESLINPARALTNLIGNGVATIAIAKSENAFDARRAREVLNNPAWADGK